MSWVKETQEENIRSGVLNYYRYSVESNFHVAHAKNIAASLCRHEIVCNIDADCFIDERMVENLKSIFSAPRRFMSRAEDRSGAIDFSTWGCIACRKEDFIAVGGYNEMMIGYGHDDVDLKNRLLKLGLEMAGWESSLVKGIRHGDRCVFYEEKDALKTMENNTRIAKLSPFVANERKDWGKAVLMRNFTDRIATSCGRQHKSILLTLY